MHSLLLYFAGMQLPLEGSCDVVDRFKYCFERKKKQKNTFISLYCVTTIYLQIVLAGVV